MNARVRLLVLSMLAFAPACGELSPRAPTIPVMAATEASQTVHVAFAGPGSLEAGGDARGDVAKANLALARLEVSAETSGDVAETTVEHVFRNDTDERLEGTFRFPLPTDAIVTGLALEIDGKMVDGAIVERDKARKAYEQVVDQMRDPALLEWDSGQTFTLRVFPIEPRGTKRVTLRFVAPLHRTDAGLFFVARPPAGDPELDAERFVLRVDGKRVDARAATKGSTGEVLVKVADVAPEAVIETTKDGAYVHVHLRPVPTAPAPGAKVANAASRGIRGHAMILLCDRSRSMLEARVQQARVASMILDDLGPGDRFTLVAGDVRARAMAGGLRAGGSAETSAALAWLDANEPDGASDIGRLLVAGGAAVRDARALGLEPVVVYLGDASPTWGETRAAKLGGVATEALGASALHLVLLGKSTDDATARALVEAGHGRLLRPKTELDATVAAGKVKAAALARRIDGVRLVGIDGADLPLLPPATIYEGDDVDFSLFVPAGPDGRVALPSPTLTGTVAGEPFTRAIPLAGAVPARDVAKRWATAKIELLERDGDAHREPIVALSLAHGVMSRFTSLLVLENDEAYARMQIARTAQPDPGDPRVSARDLDGPEDPAARVTPDHLQPGDPEVRVRAPVDARSVVVVFPFGETKAAAFERDDDGDSGAWVARFLVDRHTPDGTYEILVRITRRDGSVEILKLPYVVDTQAPVVRVDVVRAGRGYRLHVTQQGADDASRVEVRTPDGQVISLTHVRLEDFAGTWTPGRAMAAPVPGSRLHVVAVDRALNESQTDTVVP
jgi:Vault protein inter-alpha-trypsin domain/von Willebrand factor type A domain